MLMKKVMTLSDEAFAGACSRLEAATERPDVVLGIETGGRYVAESMHAAVPHCYVRLQRGSTPRKSRLRGLLARLPRPVADALRLAEAWLRGLRRPEPVEFRGELPRELQGKRRVLIVDDAVGSGATMHAVREAVCRACPEAQVECAAIAVTTRRPLVVPDKYLYSNVLIRFPWSMDARR